MSKVNDVNNVDNVHDVNRRRSTDEGGFE